MGLRLHSAKKYDIQYGNESSFNYQQETINPIIETLAEYDVSFSDEGISFSTSVWANREKLMKNVGKILQPDSEWEHQEELDELVEKYIQGAKREGYETTKEYLHHNLANIIRQSDPSNDNVYFAWF